MNKERLKQLKIVAQKLDELKDETEILLRKEEECRDNIPENMQSSERYKKAGEYCDMLFLAAEHMENAYAYLNTAERL
jgi:hypothetical protein